MRTTGYGKAVPRLLDDVDMDACDAALEKEVVRQIEREYLDMIEWMLPRLCIDRVLHRVCCQTRAVVAVDIDRVCLAFELHVDCQVDDLVRVARASHLDETHARFAVPIPRQHATHPDTSCSRTG